MSFVNIMNTAPDMAEFDVLSHSSENGKFGVPIGEPLQQHYQDALERLMLRGWIRLIDVDFVPSSKVPTLIRIFLASPEAMAWYRERVSA